MICYDKRCVIKIIFSYGNPEILVWDRLAYHGDIDRCSSFCQVRSSEVFSQNLCIRYL